MKSRNRDKARSFVLRSVAVRWNQRGTSDCHLQRQRESGRRQHRDFVRLPRAEAHGAEKTPVQGGVLITACGALRPQETGAIETRTVRFGGA